MRLVEPLNPDAPEVIWQIGAYDGVDEIGDLIEQYPNWRFCLFEANPEFYSKLWNRHKDKSNVHTYELAVTDSFDAEVDFYISTTRDPEIEWAPQVSGLTTRVIEYHELEFEKIRAQAIHFSKIEDTTKCKPTMLVTDTEGNDHRFINLVKRYDPKVYKFERCHMPDKCLDTHRRKLRNWGYTREYSTHLDDIWFKAE